MIDIKQQKTAGIEQAKRKIADIYKKSKREGVKLTKLDRAEIAKQQLVINRWQNATRKGIVL